MGETRDTEWTQPASIVELQQDIADQHAHQEPYQQLLEPLLQQLHSPLQLSILIAEK